MVDETIFRPPLAVSESSGFIGLTFLPRAFCLQIVDNQVVMVRTKEKEGYFALQVGAIDHPKPHNVSLSGLDTIFQELEVILSDQKSKWPNQGCRGQSHRWGVITPVTW